MQQLRTSLILTGALAVLGGGGCQEEEAITRQRVPRASSLQRFFGAIIPKGDKVWFLKVVGPEDQVGEHGKSIHAFFRSLYFDNKGDLAWKLPEGWTQEPGKELRYATLWVGPKGKGLEITVTPLGEEAASIPDNLNRWRRQIGLMPFVDKLEPELENYCTRETLAGMPGIVVDMLGPGARTAAAQPTALPAHHPKLAPATPPPFRYQLPEGWKETNRVQLSAVTFLVPDGDAKVLVTASAFPGDGGGVAENVNRWRKMVSLNRLDQEQLAREVVELPTAAGPAKLVDIQGGDKAPPDRNRILGAILGHDGETWFFKMTGPAQLVGKQKPSFESFVKSVTFDK